MSAFGKEVVRTITRKPGRFLALLAIVALGAGFYAGLRMTAPDMERALDEYFDANGVYDIRVAAPLGLNPEDIEAIRELPEVDDVMAAHEADALVQLDETSYTARIHSYPDDGASADAEGIDEGYLNRLDVYEGRWPERPDECLIAGDRVLALNAAIGDVVSVTQEVQDSQDTLAEKDLRIVGKAHTPYYVSSAALDASSLGSGVIQQVLYVPEQSFSEDAGYTDAFVAVRGASEQFYRSDAYDEILGSVTEGIESMADERSELRFEEIRRQMLERTTTYDGLLDMLEYRLGTAKTQREDPDIASWLVLGRDKNAGTASYTADSERVDHIARVFPTVFFLVAALVALTTMTRMVEEDRQLIGTYKALGYTRLRIAGKYLAYAAAASGLGSVAGIVVLGTLLPYVIMNAYAIMYYAPPGLPPLDVGIALAATLLSMGITLGATWFSVAATLREKPSLLMLPRAPKSGRRILLERVGPLWSKLSFTWKVTCRNLFRYKKRLVMTVIGISGCTALLLTGLGLHDAINDIIDIQYGEIIHNNVVVSIEDDATHDQLERLDDVLSRGDIVRSSTKVCSETMLGSGPRASGKRVDVVSPSDEAAFSAMKTLRTREGHEPLSIPEERALVNEKLAQELGLAVGDTLTLHKQDAMGNEAGEAAEVVIGGLFENYIYNYVLVDAGTYEAAFGHAPEMNAVYANVEGGFEQRSEFDRLLDSVGCVRTVSYNDEVIDTYRTMLRSVDLIVVVLVVSAAALAFIVLYNLTNINIEERVREIATLKVLGFTKRETQAYIFREVALISLIGCIAGLALGVPLEGFVVTTAEVDQVMFGRAIHPPSFAIGFALTMVFSAVSMALMLPKLAHIDMVESLKSNE